MSVVLSCYTIHLSQIWYWAEETDNHYGETSGRHIEVRKNVISGLDEDISTKFDGEMHLHGHMEMMIYHMNRNQNES